MITMSPFARSRALLIGINRYRHVAPLQSATSDVLAISTSLRDDHGYEVDLLLDEDASGTKLRAALAQLMQQTTTADRILIYFAGHGVVQESARPGELSIDSGPQGFFVPQDAQLAEPQTLLPMLEVYRILEKLPCRHLLLVLDCCFAGAMRWASRSLVQSRSPVLYRERYERYARERAWQVLASASDDEKALDVVPMFGRRGGNQSKHSPFALALLSALRGDADANGDGILLATELYLHIENYFGDQELHARRAFQRPSLQPLRAQEKGEFFFFTPGRKPSLPSAVALDAASNPYRGLESYRAQDLELYFGRDKPAEQLLEHVQRSWLSVVLGLSGTGKSSLVQAGLLPQLQRQEPATWRVLGPVRPSVAPLRSLAVSLSHSAFTLGALPTSPQAQAEELLAALSQQLSGAATHTLLVIDQLEEIITLCATEAEREAFLWLLARLVDNQVLRVLMTLRLDFEPQLRGKALASHWHAARFLVPSPRQDELRQIIEGPAELRVLHFEPPELVETLINEVVHIPGALPLLSFTLSELFLLRLRSGTDGRALTQEHYMALGGVIGALQHRIGAIYDALAGEPRADDPLPARAHMRPILLRMVATDSGGRARRRVPQSEYEYGDPLENARLQNLLQQLIDARLVVSGSEDGQPYYEPAHDALVNGWELLGKWVDAERVRTDGLAFQRRLTQAALEWQEQGSLWDGDSRLALAQDLLRRAPELCNALERRFIIASATSKRRRRIRTSSIIGGVFLTLICLSGWAVSNARRERAARVEANENKQKAEDNARAYQKASALATDKSNEAQRKTNEVLQKNQELEESAKKLALQTDRAVASANLAHKKEQDARQKALYARDQSRLRQAAAVLGEDPTRAIELLISVEDPAGVKTTWEKQVSEVLGQPTAIAEVKLPRSKMTPRTLVSARLSPSGHFIAAAAADGTLWLTRGDGWGGPQQIAAAQDEINQLAFSPSGRWLAGTTRSGVIQLCELPTHIPKHGSQPLLGLGACRVYPSHHGPIYSTIFSPDSQKLLTTGADGRVILRSLAAPAVPLLLDPPPSAALTAVFSEDGRQILLGSKDGRLFRYQVGDRHRTDEVRLGNRGISHLSVQDGWLAGALWDGHAGVLSLAGQPRVMIVGEKDGRRLQLAAFIDHKHDVLLTVAEDGSVVRRSRPPGEAGWLTTDAVFKAKRPIVFAEVSADAQYLVFLQDDGQAKLRALRDSPQARELTLSGHKEHIVSVQLSQSGDRVLAASQDGMIRLYRLPAAGTEPHPPSELGRTLALHQTLCVRLEDLVQIIPLAQATQLFDACERKQGRAAEHELAASRQSVRTLGKRKTAALKTRHKIVQGRDLSPT